MVSSTKIKKIFENLEGIGIIKNLKSTQLKSTIFRIAVCDFLNNLDDLKKNPSLYLRAVTLTSTQKVLEKIYTEKFRGHPKN